MRYRTIWLMLVLSLMVARPGSAEEMNGLTLGLRTSVWTEDEKESFNQYEVFVNRELPWSWQLQEDWDLTSRLELTAGVLKGGGETGFVTSLGPSLALNCPGDRITLDVGVSPAFLNKHQYGEQSLGKSLQFVSHAGINFEVVRNLHVGYRFQHMSNASISEINPGLDLHMLELSYRF